MSARSWTILAAGVALAACSSSGDGTSDAGAGSAGTSGTAGSAGSAGLDGGDAGAAGSAGAASSHPGTIVPLYSYPDDPSWSAIIAAKQAHPSVPVIAVFNPDSGPGTQIDPTFTSGVAALKAAGIVVLGYVATGYTARDPDTAVKPDIDKYVSWYPVTDGIFFDEQAATADKVPYYAALDAYCRTQGLTVTVGNPGADVDPAFVGALDTELIYESDGVPGAAALGGWHAQHAPGNFGIIPYAVPSLEPAFVQMARQTVGWIYVTDDDLPNPWDTLPGYFPALLAELAK